MQVRTLTKIDKTGLKICPVMSRPTEEGPSGEMVYCFGPSCMAWRMASTLTGFCGIAGNADFDIGD